ncbi:hypothetical protein ACROYT_G013801 [Oculina patagonica]
MDDHGYYPYKKELKEWKKMVEWQLAEKNDAINDLREVVRIQTKRNQDIRKENKELLHAIRQIEKRLHTKCNEDEQDEKFEISEKRARVLQSRVSILTSSLRETNKQIEAMASSLNKTENQQKESSAMVNSSRSELKELTQKITNVQKSLEALECKVLQIDKKLNHKMTVDKQALLKSLLQEIYELEDEKDGLLKFTEEALGIDDEDSRIQLNEKLNFTLDKMRTGNTQVSSCL